MAIGTDAAVEFFGTASARGNSTTTITDGSFSVIGVGGTDSYTNSDDALYARAVLTMQYASGTLDALPFVALHARRLNIDGTSDEAVPDSSHKSALLGVFDIDAALGTSTDVSVAIDIPLLNVYTSQVYEFYLENQTGVTIATGWELTITPLAIGPHA